MTNIRIRLRRWQERRRRKIIGRARDAVIDAREELKAITANPLNTKRAANIARDRVAMAEADLDHLLEVIPRYWVSAQINGGNWALGYVTKKAAEKAVIDAGFVIRHIELAPAFIIVDIPNTGQSPAPDVKNY